MYQALTFIHSLLRWLVLASLLWSLIGAARGYYGHSAFKPADNLLRHWTATIAHLQLMAGIVLYTQSPMTRYFWTHRGEDASGDAWFFSVAHIALMASAIVLITLGSALAKRRDTDREKFRTMGRWFAVALGIILIAIPWPFSPFAQRPYFR